MEIADSRAVARMPLAKPKILCQLGLQHRSKWPLTAFVKPDI
jgi:hypothetical protein